jgi:hypothetical protein
MFATFAHWMTYRGIITLVETGSQRILLDQCRLEFCVRRGCRNVVPGIADDDTMTSKSKSESDIPIVDPSGINIYRSRACIPAMNLMD